MTVAVDVDVAAVSVGVGVGVGVGVAAHYTVAVLNQTACFALISVAPLSQALPLAHSGCGRLGVA